MKLWIDDIRKAPEGWHTARTVTEAIALLDENNVSEVSLDHDISHGITLGIGRNSPITRPYPCGETFVPVIRFIISKINGLRFGETCYLDKITLHSSNNKGRETMRWLLVGLKKDIRIIESPMKACNRLEIC